MSDEKKTKANDEARAAWQRNATFWDEQMGEGNAWVEELIWPATARLLGPKPRGTRLPARLPDRQHAALLGRQVQRTAASDRAALPALMTSRRSADERSRCLL